MTRTPLRISLGGGGTDLPSYYSQREGFVLSAAIDKYIFIGVNKTFTADYTIKYSTMERVASIPEIQHPIVRAVLTKHNVSPAIEVVSLADIPSGTGLGSSGSFTVGLLRTMYALRRVHATAAEIAEEACQIEIEQLGQPVGKQDQYIAAFGGLTCFEFRRDGTVESYTLPMAEEAMHELQEHLVMFFTGYSREASQVLSDQKVRMEQQDASMVENLDTIKEIGRRVASALQQGDTQRFGDLMHEHWLFKRERSAGMSNSNIDRWYHIGITSGARGGKLVGAGGGGFLLFYADDPVALRQAMVSEGLHEVRFSFDHEGSTLIVRD